MMFDPDCSLEHVSQTVDFAARHLGIPWNVCRTEIYPGTALFQRLQGAGRLDGDFRSWGYRMLDDRAELAFRVLRSCLHERAFSNESLLNKLISLAFGMQAQQALLPGTQTDTLARQVDELGRAVRQDTVDLLRRVMDFARRSDPADSPGVTHFATEEAFSAGARDAPWHRQVDRLWTCCTREASDAPARPQMITPGVGIGGCQNTESCRRCSSSARPSYSRSVRCRLRRRRAASLIFFRRLTDGFM